MRLEWLAIMLTFLIFGSLGYGLGRRFRRPVSIAALVAVTLLTIAGSYIMISTRLVSAFGFTIYMNQALVALGSGILLNLLVRRMHVTSS